MRIDGNRKESKLAKKKKQASLPTKDAVPDRAQAQGLTVKAPIDDKAKRIVAELEQCPLFVNAVTARTFAADTSGNADLIAAAAVMFKKAERVKSGDMTQVEATLIAQAVTLDTIFNQLARRAAANMDGYLHTMDAYLRLALKAQSQCRTTLETLAEIKSPRAVAFVKQANIAQGPQQVNNGMPSPIASSARAENFQPGQNKLLEVGGGERLDTGTARSAGASNSAMAAVATIDGANYATR
jgi:hypothetical protein